MAYIWTYMGHDVTGFSIPEFPGYCKMWRMWNIWHLKFEEEGGRITSPSPFSWQRWNRLCGGIFGQANICYFFFFNVVVCFYNTFTHTPKPILSRAWWHLAWYVERITPKNRDHSMHPPMLKGMWASIQIARKGEKVQLPCHVDNLAGYLWEWRQAMFYLFI